MRVKAVFSILPGSGTGFIRRQNQSLHNLGFSIIEFNLHSRLNPLKLLVDFSRALFYLKRLKPLCIHATFGSVVAFFSAFLSFFSKVPLVVTFHGSDLNTTPQADGVLRDFLSRVFSNISSLFAVKIICVSKKLSDELWFKSYIESKIVIVPCGIDTKHFLPGNKDDARSRIGFDTDAFIVLFNNGNSCPLKREDLAIESIRIASEKIPDVRLEVLRGISYEDLPHYFNASDCLLICSDTEGSPTILKEAMACNLPVVTTDVGDVVDRLKDSVGNLIVDQSADSIARGIYKISCSKIRSDSRRCVDPELSEKTIAERIKKIYLSI